MSKVTRIIAAAQDLAGKAPTRIQLMPQAAVTGQKWRGKVGRTYQVPNIDAVIAASPVPLYIDYDHLSDLPHGLGAEKPAAGWINKLVADDDGLWGEVEWTARASAAIIDKEYRFISPAFDVDASGNVLCLAGAGLTNKPNFSMKALASESAANPDSATHEEKPMNAQQLAALCAALAIAPDSDASQIVTAAQGLRGQIDIMGTHLKLTGKPTLEIASAAVTELGRLDPKAFVPKAEHDRVTTELASIQASVKDAAAASAVEAAMRAGKVTPGLKDWALGEAKRDLASFQAWEKAAPVVVEPGSIKPELASANDADANRATGITPPAGFTMRPERVELHNRAVAHQAKNPNVTYEQALRAVGAA
jgi:phage I-like protein